MAFCQLESDIIYKIVSRDEWKLALEQGVFIGAPVDVADGFIHFSTGDQLRETAAKHFHDRTGLLLLCVNEDALGDLLRYEPSRGGDLFPHYYGPLDVSLVAQTIPIEEDGNGGHFFPEWV